MTAAIAFNAGWSRVEPPRPRAVADTFELQQVFLAASWWGLIKMRPLATARDYFADGWNVFDFTVIVVSILPSTGELATLARLARLFRVLRLVSALPGLRLIVATLIRSVPGMFNVLALMSIVFYVYGVAGYHLFHEIDPTHWRTLGIALLSLFRIVTLEDWTDIMYAALEHHWWAWSYFVSFVVIGTFVVINLFIAVVINSLDEARQDRLRELQAPPTHDELMQELARTRAALARLEARLDRRP